MVNVLALSAVDRVFEPRSDQTKDYKIVASSPSTQHEGERAKTGWLGVRIMSPSEATCLSANCCFSELALEKTN